MMSPIDTRLGGDAESSAGCAVAYQRTRVGLRSEMWKRCHTCYRLQFHNPCMYVRHVTGTYHDGARVELALRLHAPHVSFV